MLAQGSLARHHAMGSRQSGRVLGSSAREWYRTASASCGMWANSGWLPECAMRLKRPWTGSGACTTEAPCTIPRA